MFNARTHITQRMNEQKINTITLSTTLPVVFRGAEKDEPVASSQVWMRQVQLNRGTDYLVEAESGTGKSSLCAFIYGNRRDYDGKILFDNSDISTFGIDRWCEIRRRHLAYLPQEMRLFGELTALENIMIKNRLTDCFDKEHILAMLDRLEIGAKADVPASRLSVGQQQRVAIIRALCQPFDFILLDEPVSHLDARNNRTVASLIVETAFANNASIITTSVGNPLLLRELDAGRIVESLKL